MSYGAQFRSLEDLDRRISSVKRILDELVDRRRVLRDDLVRSKGPYVPEKTERGGGMTNIHIDRGDGFWLGSEHR